MVGGRTTLLEHRRFNRPSVERALARVAGSGHAAPTTASRPPSTPDRTVACGLTTSDFATSPAVEGCELTLAGRDRPALTWL